MKKAVYLDLMETVLNAYTPEHIRSYTDSVIENSIQEHGFPRLVANLGILIAYGRKTEHKELFVEMMDLCVKELPVAYEKNKDETGNDFSVKEVVHCLLELEQAGVFEKSVTDRWREGLGKIQPYTTYTRIAERENGPVNNWAVFGAASEQLRKFAGIASEDAFIESQIASQMQYFDENGMYRDPGNPMVYDFVTRLQFALLLYFGYNGKYRAELEEHFAKAAEITLEMQSVTGEIPFGGRSNQFLHNEAFYAALCEFYADFFRKRGNLKLAGSFRRAAELAVEYIVPWLKDGGMYHIKNRAPIDSGYGCEYYAYYDKYMVTTASWLYTAFVMADESILPTDCPAAGDEAYLCETSSDFHMLFLKSGDYLAQIDTDANLHYDASGLGRVHKRGVPSALCLSTPIPVHPSYDIDVENPSYFAICGGMEGAFSADGETKLSVVKKEVSDSCVLAQLQCEAPNGKKWTETVTVSPAGVELKAEGEGRVQIRFPLFSFDGKENTKISVVGQCAEVSYAGHTCRYSASGTILAEDAVYANRNGHYRAAVVSGDDVVSLKIELE